MNTVVAAPIPSPEMNGRPKKLSYRQQRELESLPGLIEELEARQGELHQRMADADFYKQDSATIAAAGKELEQVTEELKSCYERWEQLEYDRRVTDWERKRGFERA